MGTPKLSQALALKTPSPEKDDSLNRLAIAIDYGTTFTGVAFALPSHARPDPPQAFLTAPGVWSRPEAEGDSRPDQAMNCLTFVFSGIPGVEKRELAIDYFSTRKSKFRAAASQLSVRVNTIF